MANKPTELDDVLESYVAFESGPSRATLGEWVQQYPQYERQLTEFTARWSMLHWLPDKPDNHEVDEEMLVLRGMSAVQRVLFRYRQATDETVAQTKTVKADPMEMRSVHIEVERPIAGLLSEGKRLGIAADDLAGRIGVSDGILRKLDRRLIDPKSIPMLITRELGRTLRLDIGQIVAYAQLAPAFAVGAQHRSNQAPTLPTVQENFFDAVRHDLTLSDERRAQLLSLALPQDQGD